MTHFILETLNAGSICMAKFRVYSCSYVSFEHIHVQTFIHVTVSNLSKIQNQFLKLILGINLSYFLAFLIKQEPRSLYFRYKIDITAVCNLFEINLQQIFCQLSARISAIYHLRSAKRTLINLVISHFFSLAELIRYIR